MAVRGRRADTPPSLIGPYGASVLTVFGSWAGCLPAPQHKAGNKSHAEDTSTPLLSPVCPGLPPWMDFSKPGGGCRARGGTVGLGPNRTGAQLG